MLGVRAMPPNQNATQKIIPNAAKLASRVRRRDSAKIINGSWPIARRNPPRVKNNSTPTTNPTSPTSVAKVLRVARTNNAKASPQTAGEIAKAASLLTLV